MIRKRWTSRESLLLLTILVGLVSVVGLSQQIESRQPALAVVVEDEKLYLTGNAVKRMALGFNGVVADWYWMRSLQYIGRKVINSQETTQLDDLSRLNLKLLAPLLDTATTVDPQFMQPYEYAALVLPAVDVTEAIRISKKGIAANPTVWRLHQHLGYIYWQQKDFKAASETYRQGTVPGHHGGWQRWKLAWRLRAEARHAREIYQRMYQESDEPDVKEMAKRLLRNSVVC